jgi:hypothetical protein
MPEPIAEDKPNELKPNDIYQDDEDIPDDAQDQYPLP